MRRIKAAHQRFLKRKLEEARAAGRPNIIDQLLGPAKRMLTTEKRKAIKRKAAKSGFSLKENLALIDLYQKIDGSQKAHQEFTEIAADHNMTGAELEEYCRHILNA